MRRGRGEKGSRKKGREEEEGICFISWMCVCFGSICDPATTDFLLFFIPSASLFTTIVLGRGEGRLHTKKNSWKVRLHILCSGAWNHDIPSFLSSPFLSAQIEEGKCHNDSRSQNFPKGKLFDASPSRRMLLSFLLLFTSPPLSELSHEPEP